MIRENILYTDDHQVTVTDSFIKVKKSLYPLKGITKHGFFVIQPDRLTPFLTLLLGAVMINLGALQLMPENFIPNVELYSIDVNINSATLVLGIGVFVLSALLLALVKDRYAIWIATAEGEKNLVVSRKREYVNKILDALNHAFFNLISPTQQTGKVERKWILK